MFFAGISIFVLSGLATLVVMGLGLLMWMFGSPNTKSMFKMIRYTISFAIIGGVMTVVGGGSL